MAQKKKIFGLGKNKEESYIDVRLIENDIIRYEPVGHITKNLILGPHGSHARLVKFVLELKKRNKPVKYMMVLGRVKSLDSTARSQTKKLKETGIEQVAVAGLSRPLRVVAPYLLRSGNLSDITKFFDSEKHAVEWLLHAKESASKVNDAKSFMVPVVFSVSLLVAALWAWIFDKPYFRSYIEESNLINPLATISLLLLCIALIGYYFKNTLTTRTILLVAAGITTLLGSILVADITFNIGLKVDTIFYTSRDAMVYGDAYINTLSAISLTFLGIMSLLVVYGKKSKPNKILFHTVSVLLSLIAIYSFIAYAYPIFGSVVIPPMNFVVMLVVLCLVYSMQFLVKGVPIINFLLRGSQQYWVAIVLFIIGTIVTAFAWQYTRDEIILLNKERTVAQYQRTTSLLQARLTNNIKSLDQATGLFYASDSVTASDFQAFYKTSDFAKNFPAVTSLAYVKAVNKNDKANFERIMRSQATTNLPEYAGFTISPDSDYPMYFPLTFFEPRLNVARTGFNLASSDDRLVTLEAALKSGEPKVTDIIDLNKSLGPDAPENLGFFVAVPIYKDVKTKGMPATEVDRAARIDGFLNAYYRNDRIFETMFKEINRNTLDTDKTIINVIEPQTSRVLYEQDTHKNDRIKPTSGEFTHSKRIRLADKEWLVNVASIDTVNGVPVTNNTLPYAVAVSGLLFTALITALAISQNRRTQQALRLAEEMTEDLNRERDAALEVQKKDDAILSSIGDAVFAIDENEKIILFNPITEYLSGYSSAEAIGQPYKTILKFIDESTGKSSTKFIDRAYKGEVTGMDGHTLLVNKSGATVPVSDSAAPVKDEKGRITGVIVVFRDVTQERELERTKDEFVSVASHQLRTPLSAMNWYTEMLINGDAGKPTDDQMALLKEIYAGNQRMTDLVSSLLDASRLDLGKLESDPKEFDLDELISSVHADMVPAIEKKKLQYKQVVDPAITTLFTDPKLLRMILQNMLSNAVKYTPEGGSVKLAASLSHNASKQKTVQLSVADTGMGVPLAQQSKLFNKMFRADNVLELEGTGLGLYIVREAALKLGGDITFKSVEGKGSTFVAEILHQGKQATKSAAKKEGSHVE